MKKSAIIFSAVIMCLSLIVAVVGFSAAWFTDIKNASDTVIINSEQPKGDVSIELGTASAPDPDNRIYPAVAAPGALLGSDADDRALDVLVASEFVAAPANRTDISFKFQYAGSPDLSGGVKRVVVYISDVTLVNKNELPEGAPTPDNYREDFSIEYSLRNEAGDSVVLAKHPLGDDPLAPPPINGYYSNDANITGRATENEFFVTIYPYIVYTLVVTVNFRFVDEATPPDLLNTTVFFNFGISL